MVPGTLERLIAATLDTLDRAFPPRFPTTCLVTER